MSRSAKPVAGRLVLLDRDGTLIEEGEYISDPKQVHLLPGVPAALRRLKRAGFKVVVATNQSGVGRGLISLKQLHAVNRRFLQDVKRRGAAVDGLYWCPHLPSKHCACRKPKLGMAKRAARDLGLSWKKSISVGDKPSDVLFGQRTGGRGILVRTGYGKKWKTSDVKPDHTAKDLKAAVTWIIRQKKERLWHHKR
jgi:D-glycero-D-manno-heptose 1,7-bisphosphate phosphatase